MSEVVPSFPGEGAGETTARARHFPSRDKPKAQERKVLGLALLCVWLPEQDSNLRQIG